MAVSASAPGKLILLGEHAVVYGYPCLVTAVDLRIGVVAQRCEQERVVLHVPGLSEPFVASLRDMQEVDQFPSAVRFVAFALKRVWEHVGGVFGVELSTRSWVVAENDASGSAVASYGLGSSSAVTVAAIKALAGVAGEDLANDEVFRLGHDVVLAAQGGLSSGFDVAAATYGGTLYYVTGGKVIEPIAVRELPLVVGYSGVKADTTEYIRRVALRRQRFPLLVAPILESIAALVNEARGALEELDFPRLGQLMNLNQGWLQALGVSTEELDSLIHAARLAGAYGAKLSGAGGGDCMIALVDEDRRLDVERAIETTLLPGVRVIRVRTGAEGVRLEG